MLQLIARKTLSTMYSIRWRIAVSAAIGLASGLFCWFMVKRIYHGAADFGWAIYAAQRFLAHQNPYDTPLEQYPLTAAFLALPFVRLQPEVAAGLFYGISSALLAFGLTRRGYQRLFIFLAFPYWAGHTIEVRFDPLDSALVEIWFQGKLQATARPVDPVVNGQLPFVKPTASPEPEPTGINFVELLKQKNVDGKDEE